MPHTQSTTGADVGPLGQLFASQVRSRREFRGLSQTDLAVKLRDGYGLKFHQATVDRVEKGQRPCRLDEVYAIAEVLGTTVDDMLDDWSSTDRAWRQLAGIALRTREAEARIALVVQQNLEAIQGDRERILNGLTTRGDATPPEEVLDWAREVLSDLDRIWERAAEFAKGGTETPGLPIWVTTALNAPTPATVAPDVALDTHRMSVRPPQRPEGWQAG